MEKTVILTGAGGYIGGQLLEIIERNNIPCIAISRRKQPGQHVTTTEWFEGDFSQYPVTEDLSNHILIHCAWSQGFDHNSNQHFGNISAHFNFIRSLTDFGLSKLVVLGSMHEYGFSDGEVREGQQLLPTNQYGLAKKALLEALIEFCARRDISFVWARLFYLLGNDSRNNSVFSKILFAAASGTKEFPLNSGIQKFDFIDSQEAAMNILLLALNDVESGEYNIGSGEQKSLEYAIEEFIFQNNLDMSLKLGVYPDPPNYRNGIWPNLDKYSQARKQFRIVLS